MKRIIQSIIKILVDFAAITATLGGICLTLGGIGLLTLYSSAYEAILPFVSGLYLLATGALLLFGVIKGHPPSVLIYFIITTPALLAADVFTFYIGVILFINVQSYSLGLLINIILFLLILLASLFAWTVQISIYFFYKGLQSSDKRRYYLVDQSFMQA